MSCFFLSKHLHTCYPDKLSTRFESDSFINRLVSIYLKLYVTNLSSLISFLSGIEKLIYLFVFSGMHLISDLNSFASSVINNKLKS